MELIKKISDNPKLVAFCNKILTYNAIFDAEESRRLFISSLINADTLVDEESCRETLDTAYFIVNHVEKAIKIAFNELRNFRKERKE